jgi:hypothetical protein
MLLTSGGISLFFFNTWQVLEKYMAMTSLIHANAFLQDGHTFPG